jgi:hypothetical protein
MAWIKLGLSEEVTMSEGEILPVSTATTGQPEARPDRPALSSSQNAGGPDAECNIAFCELVGRFDSTRVAVAVEPDAFGTEPVRTTRGGPATSATHPAVAAPENEAQRGVSLRNTHHPPRARGPGPSAEADVRVRATVRTDSAGPAGAKLDVALQKLASAWAKTTEGCRSAQGGLELVAKDKDEARELQTEMETRLRALEEAAHEAEFALSILVQDDAPQRVEELLSVCEQMLASVGYDTAKGRLPTVSITKGRTIHLSKSRILRSFTADIVQTRRMIRIPKYDAKETRVDTPVGIIMFPREH